MSYLNGSKLLMHPRYVQSEVQSITHLPTRQDKNTIINYKPCALKWSVANVLHVKSIIMATGSPDGFSTLLTALEGGFIIYNIIMCALCTNVRNEGSNEKSSL